jgi:resuscitation-promoting factor RpfB
MPPDQELTSADTPDEGDDSRFRPPPAEPLDDTQPSRPVVTIQPNPDDTQPVLSIRPADFDMQRLRRLLPGCLAVALLALVIGGGLAALLTAGSNSQPLAVTIRLNGQAQPVTTTAGTVAELLQEQAILIESGDRVTPGMTATLEDGMTVDIERARTIALTVDGRTSILHTTLDSPQDILDSAGVSVDTTDRIILDGSEARAADLVMWPVPVTSITIYHAVPVRIIDGDRETTLQTTSSTVGDALYESDITLYLADRVVPDLNTPVTPEMEIVIERARPVTLIADGQRRETRISGEQVTDALRELDITLSGLDYTIPGEDAAIVPGMSIRVIRVEEEILTEQEEIPYETVYQADPEMPLDRRAGLQNGQVGIIERTIRVRYENGVEISRVIEQEEQVQEPINRVIAYGTRIVIYTADTPDGPIRYWRRLRMYATSYHPSAVGSNTTSIGRTLTRGIVAINPRIVPYSTNLYVRGYGQGVAADTGGPRSTPYWIDLGYDDDNFVPWSRWVEVYLLEPVPDNIRYLLPDHARGGVIAP